PLPLQHPRHRAHDAPPSANGASRAPLRRWYPALLDTSPKPPTDRFDTPAHPASWSARPLARTRGNVALPNSAYRPHDSPKRWYGGRASSLVKDPLSARSPDQTLRRAGRTSGPREPTATADLAAPNAGPIQPARRRSRNRRRGSSAGSAPDH